uniref:Uncharacterized protein n=1 Tax=Takifugu rubripes TaxID=31033 RepID=A0A674PMA3_TAKRU
MHPSFSVNLEPGLDRGVPWGCDLYTFVTSAAGHMMRTLQKPRKNRPSKRQVNHRRFLHNMIQRCFADIEAANHRLASALYPKEEENNASVLAAEERDAVDRPDGSSPRKSSGRPAAAAASTCSDALFIAGDHDPSVKKDSKTTKSQTVACSAAQKREKETDEPVELTPTSSQRRPRPAGRPHNGPPRTGQEHPRRLSGSSARLRCHRVPPGRRRGPCSFPGPRPAASRIPRPLNPDVSWSLHLRTRPKEHCRHGGEPVVRDHGPPRRGQ